ncbi:MAG: InlB B-repeat-containing protein [Coraliomargaritaceae bacterium]
MVAVLLLFCGGLQTASAQVFINQFNLAPNGDFETPDAPWGYSGGGAPGSVQTVTYPATDGNPDGYVRVDTSADTWWAVLISNGDQPLDIAELGLVAGETYTFQYDMRTSATGAAVGGMKVEAWADGNSLGDAAHSGDRRPAVETADVWATYTFEYTIPANANQVKIVPLWSSGVVVDFDNIGVNVQVEYNLNMPPNGDFETPDAPWGFSGGGPGGSYQTVTYPATDGNPDGYVRVDTSADTWWTVLISNGDAPYNISELGLVAGETYTFQYDMRTSATGDAVGGMKIEAWANDAGMSDGTPDGVLSSGDVRPAVATADEWTTYTFDYTLPEGMTQIKFVPLWSSGVVVDFDNIGVLVLKVDNYTLTASASTGGTIDPAGEISVAAGSSQAFTFTADANYALGDVLVNGASVGNAASYEVTNINANTTVEALFSFHGIADSDFENGGSEWSQDSNGTGTFAYTYPATGGSADSAYAVIDHSADDDGEGYLFSNNNQVTDISYLGINPGSIYNLNVDMLVESGFNYGSVQVLFYETNADGDWVQDGATQFLSPDLVLFDPEFDGAEWMTYELPAFVPHGTEGIKIRLVSGEGSVVGFDNVGFDTTALASYDASEIADAGFDYLTAAYETNGAAEVTHNFYDFGGNPGAYAELDNSIGGGWGLLVTDNGAIKSLSDLGLNADEVYQFSMDMIAISGASVGGMKVDFFTGTTFTSSTGDIFANTIDEGANWETYNFTISIPAGVDGLKFVPLWGPGMVVGFDNLAIDSTPYVAPPSIDTWTGNGGDSAWNNAANWDGNIVPDLSGNAFNATAIIANANVQYDAATMGGDFQLRNGNILQLDNGGSWEQSNGGSWFQAGGGVIKLNGGTFNYGTCPMIAGREEATSTLEVTANGGSIVNKNFPTDLNWGTVTINGPLSIDGTGQEVRLRGKVIAVMEGAQWSANLISFADDGSRLDISGGTITINSGAGVYDGQIEGKGFNFLPGSTGEIVWGDAGVIPATIEPLRDAGNFMVDGTNAIASDLIISTRGGKTVASLANVAKQVTVTAGDNGSISGASSVAYNGTETYTITPDSGYAVADVLVDGASVGAVQTYTLSSVVQNRSISAVFVETGASYTVTASAGANGSISPAGASSADYGDSLTYTITPDAGYNILDVVVNGSSVGAVSSYEFASITEDSSISATFTDRVLLKLDFQGNAGDNPYSGSDWTLLLHEPAPGQPWLVGDENHPNVGDSGYNFSMTNIAAWATGWFWKPENGGNGAEFTLGGLTPGQEVVLYAAAGWNPDMAHGAYIVFGDSGAEGVKAAGGGLSEGSNPSTSDLTQIGTAIANSSGEVTGAIGGKDNFFAGEGQTNGFIFSIGPAPESTNNLSDWMGNYPGVGGDTAPSADPDGDGKSNAIENVLGTDPSASDSAGLSSGSLSGNTFTVTHPQNASVAEDLTVAYEWSTDLATFYADGASDGSISVSFGTATDSGTTTVTATVTGETPEKLFVRIRVTQ